MTDAVACVDIESCESALHSSAARAGVWGLAPIKERGGWVSAALGKIEGPKGL
jgi:hypothetical protein